jgi:hypothetical protein
MSRKALSAGTRTRTLKLLFINLFLAIALIRLCVTESFVSWNKNKDIKIIIDESYYSNNIHAGKITGVECHIKKIYFSYIVAVSFTGGGNRSTQSKPLACRKSLTNFIT